MLVKWDHNQGWYRGWQGKRLVVLLSKHDNCDSPDMRKRWIKTFGLVNPFFKISKGTFEIGLDVRGVLYTLFVE